MGWSTLGPSVFDTTYTNFAHYTEVSLLASNGAVLRATRANDADNGLHTVISVDRWTGTAWEHEPFQPTEGVFHVQFDPQTTGMSASKPQLASNQAGKVVLVWVEWDQNFDSNADFNAIYVARRSNVAGWSPYGNGSATGSGAVGYQETRAHPAFPVVAPNGDVSLIWNSYVAGLRTIQFRRDVEGLWLAPNGSSGQIATPDEHDGSLSCITDSQGRIYLAWTHESDSGTHQFVARLDPDGTLHEVGPGSASNSGVSGSILRTDAPRIVLDANEFPSVVWREEGRPKAKRWDGLDWRNYGSDGSTDVLGPQLPAGAVIHAMEVAAGGNRLCLAWARVQSTPETPASLRVSCTTPQP